jgi:hypothetical protein
MFEFLSLPFKDRLSSIFWFQTNVYGVSQNLFLLLQIKTPATAMQVPRGEEMQLVLILEFGTGWA